ncbi:hypothetical protein NADFUDRAFT_84499 [Nadsonia fulvescens var. elongata DSM 6958]|uniref:BSD domain-containing protein n=1 Tax=Nadsonia fulvescens var. elongata DSM 6958 TaxID=857566 RepID=A0A1E3PDA9_9ASCO|nr:hypothetical protein NADFUDRAFT_84499 [Nadsonia fulvescens var. elongata DSM 6958]
MEFYDPVQSADIENLASEADSEAAEKSIASGSTKVDQAVEQIESEITEAFKKSTSLLGVFWSNVKQQTQELKKSVPNASENIGNSDNSTTTRETASVTNTSPSENISFNSIWGAVRNTGLNVLQETRKDFEAVKEEITQIQSTVKDTNTGEYLNTLDKDLTELENKAGRFVVKLGSGFKKAIEEAIAIEDPDVEKKHGSAGYNSDSDVGEDADSNVLFNVPDDISKTSIYGTRGEGTLHALHTNETLWLDPVTKAETKDTFDEFTTSFNLDESTATITADLESYPELRKLMDRLVGEGQIFYAEFWARYYYLRHQIEKQEKARRDLLSAKPDDDDEDEFAWDDEDEHDNETKPELAHEHTDVQDEQSKIKAEAQNDGYDFVSRQNSKACMEEVVVPQPVDEIMNDDEKFEATVVLDTDLPHKEETKQEDSEELSEEDDDWE